MRRRYIYLTEESIPISIIENRKPSEKHRPISDTWIVQELYGDENGSPNRWCSVGEVTWGRLRELRYVGSVVI